jgi:hypothetical protein
MVLQIGPGHGLPRTGLRHAASARPPPRPSASSIFSGFVYDALERHKKVGPRLVLLVGCVANAAGYVGLWAAVQGLFQARLWHLAALAALAANGGTWGDTATLVTNVGGCAMAATAPQSSAPRGGQRPALPHGIMHLHTLTPPHIARRHTHPLLRAGAQLPLQPRLGGGRAQGGHRPVGLPLCHGLHRRLCTRQELLPDLPGPGPPGGGPGGAALRQPLLVCAAVGTAGRAARLHRGCAEVVGRPAQSARAGPARTLQQSACYH